MGCRETEQICHQVSGAQFSSRPSGEKTKLGPKLDTIPTLVGMYHYNYNHNYDYNYHYNYNYNSIHIIYIYIHTHIILYLLSEIDPHLGLLPSFVQLRFPT